MPERGAACGPDVPWRLLAEAVDEGVYTVDPERRITYWSPAAEAISGWPADAVVGRFCHENILRHVDAAGRMLCHTACPLAAAMHDGCPRGARVWLHHRLGHRVAIAVRCRAVTGPGGRTLGGLETFRAVDADEEPRRQLDELREAALTDTLTGLANRRLGDIRLGRCIEDLDRLDLPLAVVMADLDGFKALNDAHGHAAGDEVLRRAAATLTQSVRAEDLAVRWGGEEFLVIVHGGIGAARAVAERFRALLASAPVPFDGRLLRTTCSAGATAARRRETARELLVRVDGLLYRAKASGRNRVVAED